MIKAGTKCRVLADNTNHFKPGDIVVALEDGCVPYCCLIENYGPKKSIDDYTSNLFYALFDFELEALDYDWSEK